MDWWKINYYDKATIELDANVDIDGLFRQCIMIGEVSNHINGMPQ